MSIWDYMKKAERPPAPEALERTPDRCLRVRWSDGRVSVVGARDLRLGCQCAVCVDEMTRAPLLDPASVSAQIDVTAIDPVGNYAAQLTFSDGHSTGLFDWRLLRRLCDEHPADAGAPASKAPPSAT